MIHMIDSYDSLPLEKLLNFHNVIIFIKSVFNRDKNNYYHNSFLEAGSYQLPKYNDNKQVFAWIINAILW